MWWVWDGNPFSCTTKTGWDTQVGRTDRPEGGRETRRVTEQQRTSLRWSTDDLPRAREKRREGPRDGSMEGSEYGVWMRGGQPGWVLLGSGSTGSTGRERREGRGGGEGGSRVPLIDYGAVEVFRLGVLEPCSSKLGFWVLEQGGEDGGAFILTTIGLRVCIQYILGGGGWLGWVARSWCTILEPMVQWRGGPRRRCLRPEGDRERDRQWVGIRWDAMGCDAHTVNRSGR